MALTLDPPVVEISGIGNAVGAGKRIRSVPGFVRHENYDAVLGTEVDLLKHPVFSAAVGTAAVAAGAAEAAYRVAEKVPVLRAADAAQRIGLPVGFLRAIGCVVFPIGLLWVVVDRKRRSLQDIVFRTRVVYSRPAGG